MADTDGSQNSLKSSQFSQSDLPELLNQYYKRLFPYKQFVQWLSYGGGKGVLCKKIFGINDRSLISDRSFQIWNKQAFCFWMVFYCVDSVVPKNYFVHREFSFTLKDDVYLRYQSFADQQELEKEILKRNPYKIDIGAVFTHKVELISGWSNSCFCLTKLSGHFDTCFGSSYLIFNSGGGGYST